MNITSGTSRLSLNRKQSCPWKGCREVWSMPTTFINISSRDLNIMVYRKANLWGFFPWRPVDVDIFFLKQTSFTDDCIQSKTLWSISIIALLCKTGNFSTENIQFCSVKILLLCVWYELYNSQLHYSYEFTDFFMYRAQEMFKVERFLKNKCYDLYLII